MLQGEKSSEIARFLGALRMASWLSGLAGPSMIGTHRGASMEKTSLKWCSGSGGKTVPTGRCRPAWEEGRAIKTQLRESTQAFPTSELSSSLFRKTFPGYMKRMSWTVFLIQGEKVSTLDWSNQRVGPDICLGKFRKSLKQSLFPSLLS